MSSQNGKSLRQRAQEAADHILQVTGDRPRVAMLLGTGHSSIAGQLKDKHTLRPDDLPEGLRFSKDAPSSITASALRSEMRSRASVSWMAWRSSLAISVRVGVAERGTGTLGEVTHRS